jgi:hypothetical protein
MALSIRHLLPGTVIVLVCMGAAPRLPWSSAVAGQGGKAEPLRIQFRPGRSSATVTGAVSGDVQAEYAFRAMTGQRLTIRSSASPVASIVVTVRTPAGGDLPLLVDSGSTMSAVLPVDGEYQMWIRRRTASPGRSTYKVTLTIRARAGSGSPPPPR